MMDALDATVQKRIKNWLNGPYDEETKQQIQSMLDEEQHEALTDAFYKELSFGTGGIRGIMGVGPNRVNKYTFGMAAQGFANYLNTHAEGTPSVAIAHDCRNNAETLTAVIAHVFTANGIQVHLFDELRPTPELSFAIRQLGCSGGVMLTASHNPKEYNGFKAYGPDGGQLVGAHATAVMEQVQAIDGPADIHFEGNDDLITPIGAEMDEHYLDAIMKQSISQDAIERQHDLSIVYSPIHGTGGTMVPQALLRFGFTNVSLVDEQMNFDGNFPTVEYPNPEEKEAMQLALENARSVDAELVMATDPDADRVGIAVKNLQGEWTLLSGNQTGTLIIHYLLSAWKNAARLDGNQYIVKTIVTSYLIDAIAETYGVACYNTLTGFKYIGELMTALEGEKTFIAGGEESYGYLIGEHVRDKDAVISAAIIAEMTAFYKDQGSSLFEALIAIYKEHGYYREKLVSVYKRGKKGAEEIQQMLTNFRENPPESLGGSTVTQFKDYRTSQSKDTATGKKTAIDLPTSNVLQFFTDDGTIVSVRPSGTEPKIKFYCSVQTHLDDESQFDTLTTQLDSKMHGIIDELSS